MTGLIESTKIDSQRKSLQNRLNILTKQGYMKGNVIGIIQASLLLPCDCMLVSPY